MKRTLRLSLLAAVVLLQLAPLFAQVESWKQITIPPLCWPRCRGRLRISRDNRNSCTTREWFKSRPAAENCWGRPQTGAPFSTSQAPRGVQKPRLGVDTTPPSINCSWGPKNPTNPPQSIGPLGACDFRYFSHAAGLGMRYDTPVGPIRLDVGTTVRH